jgi:hypothetical protein
MPRPNKTPVQVTLTPDEKHTVDEFRRRQPDLPTRADAIRKLALDAIQSLACSHGEHGRPSPK